MLSATIGATPASWSGRMPRIRAPWTSRLLVSMPCPIPGRYFVMAEAGIGGGAVEYFLERLVFATDRFGDHSLAEKFAALEHAIDPVEPGSGGVLFLPWLTGSITPAEDGKVRGAYSGGVEDAGGVPGVGQERSGMRGQVRGAQKELQGEPEGDGRGARGGGREGRERRGGGGLRRRAA